MSFTPRRRVGGYILLAVVAVCVAFFAGRLWSVLGVSMFVALVALTSVAVTMIRGRTAGQPLLRLAGTLLIVVAVSGLATIIAPPDNGADFGAGGWLGATICWSLQAFTSTGAAWLLFCCLASGLLLAADDIIAIASIVGFHYARNGARRARELAPQLVRRLDVSARFHAAKTWVNGRIESFRARRDESEAEDVTVHDTFRHSRVLGGNPDDTHEADAIAEFAQANPVALALAPRVRGGDEIEADDDVDADDESEAEDVTIVHDTFRHSRVLLGGNPENTHEADDEVDADDGRMDSRLRGNDDVHADEVRAEEVRADARVEVVENVEAETTVAIENLPPIDALTASEPFNVDEYESAILEQADKLQQAFADFGFKIDVTNIQTGPVIGQFEIQLEKGLRLSKIMSLTDDLAIALKVQTVRIVAPLPGRNTVGVEIPNVHRRVVRLRDVMEQSSDKSAKMAIPVFLGQDATGQPLVVDLAKLPHLLIAGRTGTGKSVCLNSIIVSILMTRRSDEVRMLMIDPKMVELSPYKTIPHLMHPVVTDMRKAEAILGWAVEKMEDRYRMLARAGVRQLSEYNRLTEPQLYKRTKPESDAEWNDIPKSMPYVVIVADELADLMMTAGKEVESHIIRLAQKSRAVGIHLVLATQKPTVDIITGLIKSNLPARIAFQVASRSDSQVVLDRNGAEKLLGNGDMLFLQPGTSLVERGQGTYVSDDDIESIIEMVSRVPQEFAEELVALEVETPETAPPPKEARDAIYEQAVECIIHEGKGSVSLLQRKLEIGYGRAARIIDAMETDGIVGTSQGAQPREVLMTLSQWRYQTSGGAAAVAVVETVADEADEFVETIEEDEVTNEAAEEIVETEMVEESEDASPEVHEYTEFTEDNFTEEIDFQEIEDTQDVQHVQDEPTSDETPDNEYDEDEYDAGECDEEENCDETADAIVVAERQQEFSRGRAI